MDNFKYLQIPKSVFDDIDSPEVKEYVITRLVQSHRINCAEIELEKARTTISIQATQIEELEQKVDDLQKALDTVLLNKCRTRKVRVKYIGRT